MKPTDNIIGVASDNGGYGMLLLLILRPCLLRLLLLTMSLPVLTH
jgi:hypothetical protein